MQFYDFRHAAMRLDHSVVRLDDIPIYIEQVECGHGHFQASDCMISYSVVGDPRKCKHYTTLYNPHLNLTPVPLGLVNLVGEVVAVGRLPQRQWKVGLTTTNIHVRKMSMGPQLFMGKQDMLRSSELKHTILNEYPSVAEILATDRKTSSGAFSRNFWVMGDMLRHATIDAPVGTISEKGVKLHAPYIYLKEQLDAEIH